MKRLATLAVSLGASLVWCAGHTGAQAQPTASASAPAAVTVASNPSREAYFGDLHLHTGYSFDAYVNNRKAGPDEAYRFGRGDTVVVDGETVKRTTPPLDFLAVTDHAEWIGAPNERETSATSAAMTDYLAQWRKATGLDSFIKLGWPTHPSIAEDESIRSLTRSAWQQEIAAANRYYAPGRFTTFIAYEWTSAPVTADGVGNLHRNVIFKGNTAPQPFSSIDSAKPEDLWTYLEKSRAQGYDALAIPHCGDLSWGLMFDWVNSDGRPIDQAYAMRRAANEPLFELVQVAGQSDTRPEISTNDEFSNFEVVKAINSKDPNDPAHDPAMNSPGNFARTAFSRGLKLAQQTGTNPYKFGFVGGSDAHNARSDSGEAAQANPLEIASFGIGSPGLTGVWAEQNTRESIFAALRRKETFATSGTRMKFRFFGGWNFEPTLLQQPDWVKTAYRSGVPMGADLPARSSASPCFAIWAMKDPNGANLDRAQVIKVWLDHGQHAERIYNVALSDRRQVDPKTGKTPPVGNTVDLTTATYTNTIGATELAALWRDPDFDPKVAAVYYLRVLEIPTPRWSTFVAVKSHQPLPKDAPATLQEHGWSSPIWFSPKAEPASRKST